MANYKGSKCIICGVDFEETDDIVVCPDCGTPYHRDCYNQVGECINSELHSEGISWNQKKINDEKTLEENAEVKEEICPRCGFVNDSKQNFCSRCGLPLNNCADYQHFNEGNSQKTFPNFGPMGQGFGQQGGQFQNGQPFNPFAGGFVTIEEDTDIDGVKAKDISDYVGSNKLYFLSQFMRFAKLKIKRSFNFCAFLFPEYYYFYRKMLGHGFFFLTFEIAMWILMQIIVLKSNISPDMTTSDIFTNISSSSMLSSAIMGVSLVFFIIRIISGMFSNFWYFKKTKHDIEQIDKVAQSEVQRRDTIAKKGGTSFAYTIGAIAAYNIIIRIIAMLIS